MSCVARHLRFHERRPSERAGDAPHPKDYHRDDPGNAVTEDGRAVAVAVTRLSESLEMLGHVEKAVDTALCS
ncbi:hypothetical protein [Microbispora sp. NBRC 16548]|uniref:hypothetical protein n=1 Tax=Microbispora sp. NBRC 16548 TaxID=3030994 RepID=UPI002554BB65|nr:hypothetical protein [Microbispora sp. NBRC 16548]